MPDLAERREHEAALASGLSVALADARQRADRGESIDWGSLTASIRGVTEDELAAVWIIVFLMMADDDVSQRASIADSLGRTWSRRQADAIADGMAENMRRELAAGVDPATVFSGRRAEVVAATEVTRAITAAETQGRRTNLEKRGERPGEEGEGGDGGDRPGAGGEGAAAPPLRVGDGLVAVWVTERDSKVCPICKPLDRQKETEWIGEFPSGPPAHPNCRCYLTYEPLESAS